MRHLGDSPDVMGEVALCTLPWDNADDIGR